MHQGITKIIPSIAIFISGYTPLFLIMIIKDIKNFCWYQKTLPEPVVGIEEIKIPYWVQLSNPEIGITLLLLSVVSILVLSYVIKHITTNPFEIVIQKAKSRSSEVVNYTIPYMISFVAFDLSKWQDLISLVVFLAILCLLSIRSQSIFINPILAAKGYGLYDCTYTENGIKKECVMLSRRDLSLGDKNNYKKINKYMGIIAN